MKKLISEQEDWKKNQPGVFSSLPHRGNLLSYLHQQIGNMAAAKGVNDSVLQRYPSNIMALTINIHLSLDKKDFKGAEDSLEKLESMEKCPMLCCFTQKKIGCCS